MPLHCKLMLKEKNLGIDFTYILQSKVQAQALPPDFWGHCICLEH